MTLIAAGIICYWTSTAASIPSGWTRVAALDSKYAKGVTTGSNPGNTGGALTHTHTTAVHTHAGSHTHTTADSTSGSGATARDTGTVRPPDTHTHVSNPATVNPTINTLANDTPASNSVNHEPAHINVIHIQSNGTPGGFPNNSVVVWNNASAPAGWNLADGAAGRPDFRNRLAGGASSGSDGGGAGGADQHTHTLVSHDHGTNYSHDHPSVTSSQTATAMVGGPISGANVATATQTHTHALTINSQAADVITANTDTTGSGSSLPTYITQAFIQNNNGIADLAVGMIGLWTGTLAAIPSGWISCDGTAGTPDLRNRYVRGASSLGTIGLTSGSASHTHSASGHTHAVAAHAHTVTVASGAGSNETAGAVNSAITAHTHPAWPNTGSSAFTSGTGTPTVNSYADTQPPFYEVAYVQFAGLASSTLHRRTLGNRTGSRS